METFSRTLKVLALLGLILSLASCAATPPDSSYRLRKAILNGATPAEQFSVDTPNSNLAVQKYQQVWRERLRISAYRQQTLSLKSRGDFLGLNVLLPPQKPVGTVFVLHGYLANSLTFAGLDAQFIKQRWAVTAIDLPGHGISDGPRADIDHWSRYGAAVDSWLTWAEKFPQQLPRPWVLVAHSLGGAAVIDDYSHRPQLLPDRTVLVAPLVHTVGFGLESLGYALTGWAIHQLPPAVPAESYLAITSFPTHWFKKLAQWNSRLAQLKPWATPRGLVLQGTNDSIVDGKYNTKFLSQRFPGLTIEWLAGVDHLMLTQAPEKTVAWRALFGYLASQGLPVSLP